MRYCALLLVFLTITLSCIDKDDYKLSGVQVHPVMAIPLAFGDLSIIDLLKKKDSAYVKIDANDQVFLDYTINLFSQNLSKDLHIPDKSVNQSLGIPGGVILAHANDIRKDSVTEVVDLGLNPQKLSEIDFKAGTITYSATLLPGNANLPFELIFSSSDFISKINGQPLLIKAPPSGTLSLADYKVTLNKNKFNLKMVAVLKAKNTNTNVTPGTSIAATFALSAMEFNTVKGFLGDQVIHTTYTTLNIDAFGNALGDAHVSFAAPKVSFDVTNDYGVPTKLDFIFFQAIKDDQRLNGQLNPANPVPISSPALLGNSATTSISVPNSAALMDFGPTSMVYQVDAHVNQGLTTGNNFLADTSALDVKLHVELPLAGHGSNIIMRDTAHLDLSNITESQIESASLKVVVNNELPMNVNMQLYLTDENYTVLDSIFTSDQTSLIKASTVAVTGELEAAGQLDEAIVLDTDKLNKLFQSKYLIIKAILSTSKDDLGNTPDVKFKSKYRIVVNMGLLAEMNFTIKN